MSEKQRQVTCLAGSGVLVLAACLMVILAFSLSSQTSAASSTWYSLKAATLRAFQSYVSEREAHSQKSLTVGDFLWVDDLGKKEREEAYARLRHGDVILRRVTVGVGSPNNALSGGMIHDWEGIVFIPGAKLNDVLEILQDYDHHAAYFAPDMEQSRIESHDGNHYRVFYRFRWHKVVTVVLNSEHDVNYFRDTATRAHSRSSALRIAEVDDPGGPKEKEKQPGEDNGFLWRMETWWRMEEKDGGVYVQNNVVSLTRDIPTGLAWLIEPFITSIPKESLEFTLGATRKAVSNNRKP
jgi:hypothetical protein